MTPDEERAANRAAFPLTAEIMDEFRRVFGPGIRLVWARENGRTLGPAPEDA